MAAILTYAIGDIHGSYTKVANLLRHCSDHCGGNDARFGRADQHIVERKITVDDRLATIVQRHGCR